MPLEIRELVVNTNFVSAPEGGSPSPEEMKADIIEECVEKVLQILKDQKEL